VAALDDGGMRAPASPEFGESNVCLLAGDAPAHALVVIHLCHGATN